MIKMGDNPKTEQSRLELFVAKLWRPEQIIDYLHVLGAYRDNDLWMSLYKLPEGERALKVFQSPPGEEKITFLLTKNQQVTRRAGMCDGDLPYIIAGVVFQEDYSEEINRFNEIEDGNEMMASMVQFIYQRVRDIFPPEEPKRPDASPLDPRYHYVPPSVELRLHTYTSSWKSNIHFKTGMDIEAFNLRFLRFLDEERRDLEKQSNGGETQPYETNGE